MRMMMMMKIVRNQWMRYGIFIWYTKTDKYNYKNISRLFKIWVFICTIVMSLTRRNKFTTAVMDHLAEMLTADWFLLCETSNQPKCLSVACRERQEGRPWPQRKCPPWWITSNPPSFTPLRFPKVSQPHTDPNMSKHNPHLLFGLWWKN